MGPENHVLHDAHYVPSWVKVSPFIAMISGLALRFGSTCEPVIARSSGRKPAPALFVLPEQMVL